MTLNELVRSYREAEARRAMGGIRAITGFDFQLRVHLAEFVEALARGNNASGGDEFIGAFETLTDSIQSEDGSALVLLQIKRTLTRRTLVDAVIEFSHVERFLSENDESLHPEYKVVCERSEMVAPPDFSDLTIPNRELARSPWLADCWSRIVSSGRFRGTQIEPDPWWRLVCAAAPVIKNPFDFARRALDLCLHQGTNESAVEWVRDRVAELFFSSRTDAPSIMQTLQVADFEPVESALSISVGKTASIELLRHRQYMRRRAHVDSACNELFKRLHTRDRRETHTLDVMWITGKSGSGKSVLLLQVMQEMVASGCRCVWLKRNARELHALLNAWRAALSTDAFTVPEIIFVDDLYDPLQRDAVRLADVSEMVAHNRSFPWPLVVTCGPPEFEAAFEREFGRDAIEVIPWRLRWVDSAEAEQLLAWFEERTGRRCVPGVAFAQEERLMISLAFELQHGELAPFARNFRARLRASELDECLRVPLALNRLYIWTPREWLTDSEWERLDAVNQENDFSVFYSEERECEYIRLTHPHISDEIYRTVRDPATPLAFAIDLGRAFDRSLPDYTLTCRNLMRIFASGHERLGDVDLDRLAQTCVEAWLARFNSIDESHVKHIAEIWVSWAEWNSRCHHLRIDSRLKQSSVAAARQHLAHAGVLRTVLWQRLLRAYPDDGDLVVDGISLMLDARVQASPGWSYVWEALLDVKESGKDFPGIDLYASASAWLRAKQDNPGWPFVVQRLLKPSSQVNAAFRKELLSQVWMWLAGREAHASWQFLWSTLADGDDLPDHLAQSQVELAGADWLARQPEHTSWNYVWQKLIEFASSESTVTAEVLTELALDWLPEHFDSQGWSHVWERAIEQPSLADLDNDELLKLGFAWLKGRGDWPDWNIVWQRLAARLPKDAVLPAQELCDIGFRWLETHFEYSGWSVVWRSLVDIDEDRAMVSRRRLARLGAKWLAVSPSNKEFHFVATTILEMLSLLPADSSTHDVQSCIFNWLGDGKNRDEPAWMAMLELLVDSGFSDPRFADTISPLLIKDRTRPQWARIASKFICSIDDPATTDRLAGVLADWLSDHADHLFDIRWLNDYVTAHSACKSSQLPGWLSLSKWLSDRRRRVALIHDRMKQGDTITGVVLRNEMDDFVVDVGVPAICWASQISDPREGEGCTLIGQELSFVIERADQKHGRIVVSHRRFLERSQTRLLDSFEQGDLIDAKVTHVADHAVFAESSGVRVRILARELSWREVEQPSDVTCVGDTLRVKILKVAKERKRIEASLREAGPNPWEILESTLTVGSTLTGTIVSIKETGAVVTLDSGITGFVHISKFRPGQWVEDPAKFVSDGQRVMVRVLYIDPEERRLSLALEDD